MELAYDDYYTIDDLNRCYSDKKKFKLINTPMRLYSGDFTSNYDLRKLPCLKDPNYVSDVYSETLSYDEIDVVKLITSFLKYTKLNLADERNLMGVFEVFLKYLNTKIRNNKVHESINSYRFFSQYCFDMGNNSRGEQLSSLLLSILETFYDYPIIEILACEILFYLMQKTILYNNIVPNEPIKKYMIASLEVFMYVFDLSNGISIEDVPSTEYFNFLDTLGAIKSVKEFLRITPIYCDPNIFRIGYQLNYSFETIYTHSSTPEDSKLLYNRINEIINSKNGYYGKCLLCYLTMYPNNILEGQYIRHAVDCVVVFQDRLRGLTQDQNLSVRQMRARKLEISRSIPFSPPLEYDPVDILFEDPKESQREKNIRQQRNEAALRIREYRMKQDVLEIEPVVPSTPPLEDHKNDSLSCPICLDSKVNIVLVPCGHTVCNDCKDMINDCPICREPIKFKQQVFF
jgi:hypothetical protein